MIDRYWKVKIMESPKVISYCKFKHNASLEKYIIKNVRHKIALTRQRLSDHYLRIETGWHLRPKLTRHERKCFICNDEIETELHFVVKYPLYASERKVLYPCMQVRGKYYTLVCKWEESIIPLYASERKVLYPSMQVRGKYYTLVCKREESIISLVCKWEESIIPLCASERKVLYPLCASERKVLYPCMQVRGKYYTLVCKWEESIILHTRI